MKDEYISNELIHFLGRCLNTDEHRYQLMKGILNKGILHSTGKEKKNPHIQINPKGIYFDKINPSCVCFCDIPLKSLERHTEKYSKFGISFKKSFLIEKGVNPVFYYLIDQLEEGKGARFNKGQILHEIISIGEKIYEKFKNDTTNFECDLVNELGEKIGELKNMKFKEWYDNLVYHIIALLKPFKSADNHNEYENFYTEREWRSIDHLEFSIQDVYRILLPKKFVKTFYNDFGNQFEGQVTFTD